MRKVKSGWRSVILPGVMVISALSGSIPGTAGGQNIQFFGGDGPGGGGPGGQEPPVNSKQIARYADLLGLDADQREAAAALLEGMQAEWDAGARKMREEMESIREEFQESRDPSIWTERLPSIMRKQRESRSRMEQTLMSDFKSLLTDEQQGGWSQVERTYRRDTTIPRGRLSGESVDLVKLAEELPLSEASRSIVQSTLDQYEADLDRALIERNDIVERAQQRAGDGPAAMERALQDEEFMKLREKAREARLKVRETNQRYARQVASALPADEAAKFNEAFTRRSFPDVFRASLAADSLNAAANFDDLTPEQKERINAIRESYAQEIERANKSLIDAKEKYESTSEGYASALGGGMNIRMFGAGGQEDGKENPVEAARGAKRSVDQKMLDNLKGILNDSQRERLPKRRERGGGGPRSMRGGPNGAAVVALDGGQGGEDVEEGNVVHVMRQVDIGPDGKPREATAVFVQKIAPGEAPPEGEGDQETIIEVHQKPGAGPGDGDPPPSEPKPD
ncbi:MAG: hypothetical protein JNK58_03190 [Phycisphaerae bacterium]|nr:hypothetical protein [Phycisphaerae bacterium]